MDEPLDQTKNEKLQINQGIVSKETAKYVHFGNHVRRALQDLCARHVMRGDATRILLGRLLHGLVYSITTHNPIQSPMIDPSIALTQSISTLALHLGLHPHADPLPRLTSDEVLEALVVKFVASTHRRLGASSEEVVERMIDHLYQPITGEDIFYEYNHYHSYSKKKRQCDQLFDSFEEADTQCIKRSRILSPHQMDDSNPP